MPKFPLVLALSLLALLGCKHPGSTRLEGHWRGTGAEGVDALVQEQANTFATGTEIIARGNQIVVSTPDGKGQQATYFVDSEDKSTLVIHTDKDGPTIKETFSFSDDGKSLTWRLGNGHVIKFAKVEN